MLQTTEATGNQEKEPREENAHKKKNATPKSVISRYFDLMVGFVVAMLIVFFLLPGLFILLSAMWPKIFSGSSALTVLSENVNRTVGYISLVLGILSIYFSLRSDKVLDAQIQQQDEFISQIKQIGENARDINQYLKEMLYDRTKDKSSAPIQDSDKANES